MDKLTKTLLAITLLMNLGILGIVGYTAWQFNSALDSLRNTQTTLDEANATVQQLSQAARDMMSRGQNLQDNIRKFNPLAR